MEHDELDERVRRLVGSLVFQPDRANSKSCGPTIYDTAWASMLSKPGADHTVEWIFPESFQFLLRNQQQNGGWAPCDSKVDTILSTLAATLALKRHCGNLGPDKTDSAASLDIQYTRALTFLHAELSNWKPEVGTHYGFEVLIPALLSMLERENTPLQFPGRKKLMALNKSFLADFDPRTFYETKPSPMLYLLEAFIGQVDFNRLGHHTAGGSIMHSPSSTAGYLMGAEVWDESCETYLRDAIRAAGNTGGAPNVFPSSGVVVVSVLEILLDSEFPKFDIDINLVKDILGCTPSITGPCNTTHELVFGYLHSKLQWPERTDMQVQALQDQMMRHISESKPCFSTRCRILKALLRPPRVGDFENHVSYVATSLCDSWWTGATDDSQASKRSLMVDSRSNRSQNLSPYYSMMLFAQGFAELQRLLDSGSMKGFTGRTVHERAPVAIIQTFSKIVSTQNSNGTWGSPGCTESTAYALLALMAIYTLKYTQILKMEIQYAVAKGREALSLMRDTEPYPVWVGKVAYGSEELSQAFTLAARKKPFVDQICGKTEVFGVDKQSQKVLGYVKYFSGLEYLSKQPYVTIKASILEASFYGSSLTALQTEIFPATTSKDKDKYLEYIPILWMLGSSCYGLSLPPQYLLDMMVLAMLIFQVDEYMEAKMAKFSKDETFAFRRSLEGADSDESTSRSELSHDDSSQRENSQSGTSQGVQSAQLLEAISVFRAFTQTIIDSPRVVDASETDKLELRSKIKSFLSYHIDQMEDNARLAQQAHQPGKNTKFATPRTSYQTWVHTVGAGHVSAHFAFAFATCSIGGSLRGGADCFSHVKQKLTAYNLTAHYGAFTRMYNDYGSMIRDAEEHNLNSINFPEFFANGLDSDSAKQAFLSAARYERQCAMDAAADLYKDLESEGSVGKGVADRLRVLIGTGEQFSDLYVMRDISNTIK